MSLYRALLYLYPSSFRSEYGDELARAFAARGGGPYAALVDVIPNAIAAHWDVFSQDFRYALRVMRQSPGFAITAVLVVALGVGANTAAFSVADYVLIQPLPFSHPERLVRVWERTPGYGAMELSPANYRDFKAGAKSFADMGAFTDIAVNLTGSGEPRRLQASLVTGEVLPLLGVRPFIGRTFAPSDTMTGQSVVLSHDLWRTQFGGSPSAIGTSIDLDGAPYTVIGVMPADFHFPTRDVDLWRSLKLPSDAYADRTDNYLEAIGRLRDGASIEHVRAELGVVAERLRREFPNEMKGTAANVYFYSDEVSSRTRLLIIALCGAALCILLLACANLANLLLARAVSREREIAVRAALGAGRERLVRQLVTESVLLAAMGGIVGVLVAATAVPALSLLVPDSLPIGKQPTLNGHVLLFAALAIALTGLGFGVVPAMRAGSPRALAALRDGSRSGGGRKQRVRGVLVALEVMASVVLLVSSGLLMRAMWKLQSTETGFRAEGVLTLRTALPTPILSEPSARGAGYTDPLAREAFYSRILSEVRALPGVKSAAYVTGLPMSMRGGVWGVAINGREEARGGLNSASLRYATPQLFATLGIPILAGRDIQQTDTPDRPWVAVVSESFAQAHWPNEDPIGKQFGVAFHDRVIVGVVGNVRVRGLEQESEPQIYLPSGQVEPASLLYYAPKDLAIKTTAPVAALLPEIRRIVRAADPRQPISNVRMMSEIVASQTASRAAQLRVLGMLTAIALLLAGIGIHGLLSFTVSRRSQEIGVRVALGAEPRTIVRMVLREGIVLALAGLVPGVALAYAAGRGIEAILVGVRPSDPLALSVAVVACALTTILGCARPALKASRVDPMAALRAE